MEAIIKNQPVEREAIYFEHEGNRAVRQGKWKLVSKDHQQAGHFRYDDEISLEDWSLFDLESDRTELNDLSAAHPEKVKAMAAQWQQWAEQTNTVPKPDPDTPK